MSETTIASTQNHQSGTLLPARSSPRIPVFTLGMSLGLFFLVSYVLCVVFDLWLPEYAMNRVWAQLLPGFTWISWPSFFLGLTETFAYGWYIALIFGPLYNFISRRSENT
jgi:2TM family of unknown function (DUF5676)